MPAVLLLVLALPACSQTSAVQPVVFSPTLDLLHSMAGPAPVFDGTIPPLNWVEPPLDSSWKKVQEDFLKSKKRKDAVRAIAARFQADETTETGLTADAPEALRALTLALHDGQGGSTGAAELRRELALVAGLKDEQKAAFAKKLVSPLTVYMALARSYAPHALDARLYFGRLQELLALEPQSLPDFIKEQDPAGEDAQSFLLRAHAYDQLIPRLTAHPEEARPLAAYLFPDSEPKDAKAAASRLEGLFVQLAVPGRRAALASFLTGLEERGSAAPARVQTRISAYLAVNKDLLPKTLRPRAEALAALLPPGVLENAGLVAGDPRALWPEGRWVFTLHFASTDGFKAWHQRFTDRGYAVDPTGGGDVALAKSFGEVTVTLRGYLHPGDEEDGFLRGDAAKEFLASVRRDLRDPGVQGVILRNHAQFKAANLFDAKVTQGKLLLDGSCRSGWDLQRLRRKCATCSFVVNTGTGYGAINNQAVEVVVEGLAEGKEWAEIGADWSRLAPMGAARMLGPWTPPYEEALDILE